MLNLKILISEMKAIMMLKATGLEEMDHESMVSEEAKRIRAALNLHGDGLSKGKKEMTNCVKCRYL